MGHKEAYTTEEFSDVCKITGEYVDCAKYIAKNGGQIYTQVDGEDYTRSDGTTYNVWYVQGNRYVNRTGIYGVI